MYCSNEMERGTIQTTFPIIWAPGEKVKWIPPVLIPDSIILSKYSLKISAVKAYACRNCQKAIIDYSNPKLDLNFL